MNIKHLEYILEVYRCGSINKAAKACYISQPRLSKIVQDMEAELGFPIISRSSSGLTFNENGIRLIESAEKIVQEAQKIQKIPELSGANGSMHVVSSPSALIMQSFLAFRRPHFATDHDGSDIYKEYGLNEITQQVMAREAPLGIMVMFDRMVPKYQTLTQRYDLSMDLIRGGLEVKAIMSVHHPLACKESICIADLQEYPFVLDSYIDYDDTLAGMLKIKPSANTLIVSNRASRMDAIRSGFYICHTTGLSVEEMHAKDICTSPLMTFSNI